MPYTLDDILKAYEILVKGIESDALNDDERAFGGIIRSAKGKLVESIAQHLVEIAWQNLGGNENRLSLERQVMRIPINKSYISKIKSKEVREHILNNLEDYFYGLKTDVHVSIDNKLVMGIECKAYTENAMLKRILVDFTLLKSVFPNIKCVLLQLESQLTGDYSQPRKKITFGSPSTHTLLSYFDVDLHIITLLEGERKVDQPIHSSKYYKSLERDILESSIKVIEDLLKEFAR